MGLNNVVKSQVNDLCKEIEKNLHSICKMVQHQIEVFIAKTYSQ